MNNNFKFKLASFLATYFNIGRVKYAPGTFGSLATFPLFVLISTICIPTQGNYLLLRISLIFLFILFSIFCISYWSINIYIKETHKEDPSEVVIDEVLGQMIAYIMPIFLFLYFKIRYNIELTNVENIILNIILITMPFIFFRFFDIMKFGLVGYCDTKIDGAIGIIMDDVVAGVYAGLLVSLIFIITFGGIFIIK